MTELAQREGFVWAAVNQLDAFDDAGTAMIRCTSTPATVARMEVGMDLMFIVLGGSCPELDENHFALAALDATAGTFDIECAVAGSLTGVTAAAQFQPIDPRPDDNPAIQDMVQVFVHHHETALAHNRVGYLFATRAEAAQMITDGDAVSAYEVTFAGPYVTKDRPWP